MVENMKIPEGYKMTEVGVIPEEWEVTNLLNCCIKITDGTHDTPKPIQQGIPFLTAIHVKDNYIDFKNCYYLPQKVHEIIYRRCNPEINDVLMVNIGSGIATTALVNVEYEFSLKNVALLKPNKNKLNGTFLNYYKQYSKEKIIKSISTGGAQPFLSLKQIGKLIVVLPPLQEQQAIATALTDIDNLITSIERLIDKKEKIKQGTMQELLTGKKRLPGFSGEWEVSVLGDLLKVRHGKSQHKIVDKNGTYPILATGGQIGWTNVFLYIKPSVLIGRKGTIDKPQYVEKPFWTIDTLFFTEIFDKSIPKYIYYLFDTIDWYLYNEASGVPSLNAATIERIKVVLPNKKEQQAIVQILSDMDLEIEALKRKLEKYKTIKQGMMQELLTGRIRLV